MLVRPKTQTILRMVTNDAGVTMSLALGLRTMIWTNFFEKPGAMGTTNGSEAAKKAEDENYLQTMEADLDDEDPVGAKIH